MNIIFHVPELSRSIPCLNNVKKLSEAEFAARG
ncbi:Uncharacterised protein [Salmonella enterica subsp. enterica serovar Daytona]|uniref:Uncharacterized protein n=1 Tax=Salmonella enterica subsp. enterica serovar Daytona TaxID=1962639 RepID=A0A447JCI8_SALET|nr:Uncharacterised protein [Salmonella enterica subsp. enterica serovar Daytona]